MVRRRNRAGVEVADDHAVTAKDWALPSAEEHAQGQRCQDRRVRVALLPATTAGRRRGPRIEGLFGEPDGDVASGPQPALVRRPVPDPIPFLVIGVHSAGFRRGHGFAPSAAWYAGASNSGYSCTNPPPCLNGDYDRPRATARSGRCSRLDGDSGRRTRATISRPGWRTPSSATSRSVGRAFERVVARGRRPRPSPPVTSSIS